MKNICFIELDFSVIGGVERVLASLTGELANHYNVHILSLCSENPKPFLTVNEKVNCVFMKQGTLGAKKIMTTLSWKVKKYISEYDFDVVFLVGKHALIAAFPAMLFCKTKFVYLDHGALMSQINEKKPTFFRKLAAKTTDKVIALTKRSMDDYHLRFKTPYKKLDYIYNWIDDALFETRGEYDSTSKYILSCGRVTAEKGYDMLVKVAKSVHTRHPDWEWHVLGDGSRLEEIKQLTAQAGLEGFIIFKGYVKDIYNEYKKYGIYVLPSYREGLPLTLLEAKVNRLPAVSFDCITGPAEILTDGEDGYLIPCYDTDMMADAICRLIEDEDLRVSFSQNSENNLEQFKQSVILEKWRMLIESFSQK